MAAGVEGKGAWLFLILHNTALSACGQAYLRGRHRAASLTEGLFVYSAFKIITFAAPPGARRSFLTSLCCLGRPGMGWATGSRPWSTASETLGMSLSFPASVY